MVITTFRSQFSVKKVSAAVTFFSIGQHPVEFCKHEPSVLFYNVSGFIMSVY